MSATISREIRLKQRPEGLPREDDFELVEASIPALQDGQVLVQNHYMSNTIAIYEVLTVWLTRPRAAI